MQPQSFFTTHVTDDAYRRGVRADMRKTKLALGPSVCLRGQSKPRTQIGQQAASGHHLHHAQGAGAELRIPSFCSSWRLMASLSLRFTPCARGCGLALVSSCCDSMAAVVHFARGPYRIRLSADNARVQVYKVRTPHTSRSRAAHAQHWPLRTN